MIPKANKSVKYLILSVLEIEVFEKLNKSRKDFIVSVLWHILSIKGRINFLQLGRFSTLCEQTYRNQFAKKFDFFSFNTCLLYTSDAADEEDSVDLGGRRIIKKKKK